MNSAFTTEWYNLLWNISYPISNKGNDKNFMQSIDVKHTWSHIKNFYSSIFSTQKWLSVSRYKCTTFGVSWTDCACTLLTGPILTNTYQSFIINMHFKLKICLKITNHKKVIYSHIKPSKPVPQFRCFWWSS